MGSQGLGFEAWVQGVPVLGSGDGGFSVYMRGLPVLFSGTESGNILDLVVMAEGWHLVTLDQVDVILVDEGWVLFEFQPQSMDGADEALVLISFTMVPPVTAARVQTGGFLVEKEQP